MSLLITQICISVSQHREGRDFDNSGRKADPEVFNKEFLLYTMSGIKEPLYFCL